MPAIVLGAGDKAVKRKKKKGRNSCYCFQRRETYIIKLNNEIHSLGNCDKCYGET